MRPTERGQASADPSTRPGAAVAAPPSDQDAHRDDPEIEALDGAQLLTQRLGAHVIEEIPHG